MVDRYEYWGKPPPEPSARLLWWLDQIEAGWRPNRFYRRLGYDEGAERFGVYIWEYLNVIRPVLCRAEREVVESRPA